MKIIKILGAVIGAIVVIAVLFLSLTDFSKYKPDIEAAVTEATGREFRINGDLQICLLYTSDAADERVRV